MIYTNKRNAMEYLWLGISKLKKKVSLALGLVSMCVIYNLICIILFSIFPFFFSFMKSS